MELMETTQASFDCSDLENPMGERCKDALNWTRLSCHDFTDNQVRLQLFALAYNLGNFLRVARIAQVSEAVVSSHAQRQAHQDRSQGRQPFALRDISNGRGVAFKKVVSGNPRTYPPIKVGAHWVRLMQELLKNLNFQTPNTG